jgi:hypothetical protein
MSSVDRVMDIAHDVSGIKRSDLSLDMDIADDLDLTGDDATSFVVALEGEFGDWVRDWPWQRFVEFNEGLSLLFPFILVWHLVTWPFRGRFHYPSRKERLELAHIAAVIDNGEWIDP